MYLVGEKVKNPVDHPIIRPSIDCVAVTYDVANNPRYQNLAPAKSHITDDRINRFTHMHQNTKDLIKKVKLHRLLGQTHLF